MKNLKNDNTFGISVNAKSYHAPTTLDALKTILRQNQHEEKFILGGGSNILFTQDIRAVVIHPALKGINLLEETQNDVLVEFSAGEVWHDCVCYCVEHSFYGVENLALIPGCAGAAPIQNIGAYGVELRDTFVSLDALNLNTLELTTFTNSDCQFGYRDSIFKHQAKGQFVIIAIRLRLSKKPTLNTDYNALKQYLTEKNIASPSLKYVFNAVIAIRQSKLPDPAKIGNAGSFFKNPILSIQDYTHLQKQYPTLPCFKLDEYTVKIPAAWLIEYCGFKGKRFGDAGVHTEQALVLVNYGQASGQAILDLAQTIQATIAEKFGIMLEMEVQIR